MDRASELDSLGILRQMRPPANLAWMEPHQKTLILDIAMAGGDGLHKRLVDKFEKDHPGEILYLSARGLIEWVNDKTGKPTYLALTWRGEDAAKILLQIARNESKKISST